MDVLIYRLSVGRYTKIHWRGKASISDNKKANAPEVLHP